MTMSHYSASLKKSYTFNSENVVKFYFGFGIFLNTFFDFQIVNYLGFVTNNQFVKTENAR